MVANGIFYGISDMVIVTARVVEGREEGVVWRIYTLIIISSAESKRGGARSKRPKVGRDILKSYGFLFVFNRNGNTLPRYFYDWLNFFFGNRQFCYVLFLV